MNIFYVSNNPTECAMALDDKRLVKMVLETAQIASSAMRLNGLDLCFAYKLTHKNHPCVLWASHNRENFKFLLDLGIALGKEYTHRYGKIHKSSLLFDRFMPYCDSLKPGKFTAPPAVVDKDMKSMSVTAAYQRQLNRKWTSDKRTPKWTNRNAPEWIKEEFSPF